MTDDNSGNPYVVSHSLGTSEPNCRVIGSPSGSGGGNYIDGTSFTEQSDSWTSGAPITPNTYGYLSDGSTLNREYRFYNQETSPLTYYSLGYVSQTTSDPNNGSYYYISLSWAGQNDNAKILRDINGGGFNDAEVQNVTFNDDGVTPWNDTTTVTPAGLYPSAGYFESRISGTGNGSLTIKGLDDYLYVPFLNSSNTVVAYIEVTNTTQMYFKHISSNCNFKLNTTGFVISDGNLVLADGTNVNISNGANGTKFGTATNAKIGFWNATPVVQSTGWSPTNVTTDKVFDANATTLDEIADVLGSLIIQLRTYGLLGA